MKNTLKKLKKLMNSIENDLYKREIYFINRTIRWQDSIKGEKYLTESDKMQEILDNLTSLVNKYQKEQ